MIWTCALTQTNHSACGLNEDNTHCAPLTTASGGAINWIDCCQYVGVFFTTGCTFKGNFDNAKSCIFKAFNALYSTVGRLAFEEVVFSLIRAKCLPILLCDKACHETVPHCCCKMLSTIAFDCRHVHCGNLQDQLNAWSHNWQLGISTRNVT